MIPSRTILALQTPAFYNSAAELAASPLAGQKASADLCAVCACYSPVVEPVPQQYVLADITGLNAAAARALVHEAAAAIGATVLGGMAGTRWVACCALTHLAHTAQAAHTPVHSQLVEVAASMAREFLAPLPLHYLHASGLPNHKALAQQLYFLGIRTCGELANTPVAELISQFGTSTGPLLHALALGVDPTPVRALYPPDSATVTFRAAPESGGLAAATAAEDALCQLSASLAEALAARAKAVRRLTLIISLRQSTTQHQLMLPQPVMQPPALLAACRRLWRKVVWSEPILAMELRADELERPVAEQVDIFAANPGVSFGVALALQSVHARFGAGALVRAGQLPISRREQVRALWERENL